MTGYKNKRGDGIWIILFLYWLMLLVWQNLRGSEGNRGGLDLAIKFILILMLSAFCIIYGRSIRKPTVLISMIYLSIVVLTQLTRGSTSTADLMYYFFPIWMCLLVYSIGDSFRINRQQLFRLLNCVIVAVGYIVVYALVFCTDSFLDAASVTNAYGNELRSFLFSSHEYGLYLCFGSVSIILILELDKTLSNAKKTIYIITLIAFLLNLVLTFSRSALVSFLIILVFFVLFFHGTKGGKVMLYIVLAVLAVIFLIPSLREYFADVVFKKNNDAGRYDIVDVGFEMFRNGTLFEKLFGYTYGYQIEHLKFTLQHESFHNVYLQLLVSNGIVGLIYEIFLIVIGFQVIYRTMKTAGKYKKLVKLFYGFLISACSFMMFQTTILFSSSIDSFFLTMFAIIIPKYVCNSIQAGTFDDELSKKPAPSKYIRR